jgi:hypothetical protein
VVLGELVHLLLSLWSCPSVKQDSGTTADTEVLATNASATSRMENKKTIVSARAGQSWASQTNKLRCSTATDTISWPKAQQDQWEKLVRVCFLIFLLFFFSTRTLSAFVDGSTVCVPSGPSQFAAP